MSSKRGSKTFSRRRPTRTMKRANSKRGPTTKSLSKKVKNIENNLIELKWHDLYDAIEVARASVFPNYHLTAISQGDQPFQRNGNIINTTSVQIRFSAFCPRGERLGTHLRVIVYWDRQSNQLDNAISGTAVSLLDNTGGGINTTWLTPINYNAIDRFDILYDRTFTMQSLSRASNSNPAPPGVQDETAAYNERIFKKIILKTHRKVKYGSETATFPISNALKVAFMSNIPGADEAPEIELFARVYFKDA